MKLRNRKTGEIIEFDAILPVKDVSGDSVAHLEYGSLAELNEEWEDYEDPKMSYFINWFGEASELSGHINVSEIEKLKQIDNYFETKEEAEKAVEKLKAWKRLKDKGIRVVGWDYSVNVDLNGCKFNDDDFIVGLSAGDIDEEDLDLLFSREDD